MLRACEISFENQSKLETGHSASSFSHRRILQRIVCITWKIKHNIFCQKNPSQLQKPEIAFISGTAVWGLVHSVVLVLVQDIRNRIFLFCFLSNSLTIRHDCLHCKLLFGQQAPLCQGYPWCTASCGMIRH